MRAVRWKCYFLPWLSFSLFCFSCFFCTISARYQTIARKYISSTKLLRRVNEDTRTKSFVPFMGWVSNLQFKWSQLPCKFPENSLISTTETCARACPSLTRLGSTILSEKSVLYLRIFIIEVYFYSLHLDFLPGRKSGSPVAEAKLTRSRPD